MFPQSLSVGYVMDWPELGVTYISELLDIRPDSRNNAQNPRPNPLSDPSRNL
jgi:hypothetical protein